MSLGKKQERFSRLLCDLLNFAHQAGYEVRLGDIFRDPRVHGGLGEKKGYGHRNSAHKLKLAADLNLTKDGVYLQGEAAHRAHTELHKFWDFVGGAERIPNDLNHYSFEHGGIR